MIIKKFEKFSRTNYLNLIDKTIDSGIGGRDFFNKIDSYIKEDPDVIKEIFSGLEDRWVVSSGSFGDRSYELWNSGQIKCKGVVVFNGKIVTKNKGINSYYPENFDLDNKEFIFVDDSIFSGKTVDLIENYLIEEHKSKIVSVKVGYDGSRNLNREIESLYNYYKESKVNNFFNFISELHRVKSSKREVDTIFSDPSSPKSTGAGILLRKHLREMEIEDIISDMPDIPKHMKRAVMGSRDLKKVEMIKTSINNLKFLQEMSDIAPLYCEYCKKGPLKIYTKGDFKKLDGATCDHKTPISKGGDRYNYNNLAVCCFNCNMKKSDMSLEEWNRLRKNQK
jgi:hypothetical protein